MPTTGLGLRFHGLPSGFRSLTELAPSPFKMAPKQCMFSHVYTCSPLEAEIVAPSLRSGRATQWGPDSNNETKQAKHSLNNSYLDHFAIGGQRMANSYCVLQGRFRAHNDRGGQGGRGEHTSSAVRICGGPSLRPQNLTYLPHNSSVFSHLRQPPNCALTPRIQVQRLEQSATLWFVVGLGYSTKSVGASGLYGHLLWVLSFS